ncbi:MAG: polysaccharide deacetylase family protein [Betaproteobacteria bacterium]
MTYHSVIDQPLPFYDWSFLEAAEFRRQLAYLKEHFFIVHLSRALELLKKNELVGPTVAITFDDGFRNNFDVAFPILQEFRAPSTIYLATDPIGSEKTVWFTRLLMALQTTQSAELLWNGEVFPLRNATLKAESSARLQSALKRFAAAKLEEELARIESILCVPSDPHVPEKSPFRMLDQGMIRTMRDTGLVEFGAHTSGHAILSRLSRAEKTSQIRDSLRRVEELSGEKCLTFAYPNGAKNDFDLESQQVLTEAGIRGALTMVPGINRPTTDPMEIHRYPIGADTSFSRFRLMVHNVA